MKKVLFGLTLLTVAASCNVANKEVEKKDAPPHIVKELAMLKTKTSDYLSKKAAIEAAHVKDIKRQTIELSNKISKQ